MSLAMSLRQNMDPEIQNLSTVTKRHMKRKDDIFDTFLGYLSQDPKLAELTDKVRDPEDEVTLVSKFILYTRGPKTRYKHSIVNNSLICFIQNHKRGKPAPGLSDTHTHAYEYQSTTWDTMLKTLFSFFAENGIMYKHPTDFMNGRGTYTAVLNTKFAAIAKERIDFGSLPNRSAIDMSSFDKVRQAINEEWLKPHENFSDLTLLINFLLGVTFMLRGRDEHCQLTWSNIQFSTVTSGRFLGRRKLQIVSLLDKTAQVSVTNPKRRDNTDAMCAVECLSNHSTCVVYWVHYYRMLCHSEQKRFYCYPASAKLLKVSKSIVFYITDYLY